MLLENFLRSCGRGELVEVQRLVKLGVRMDALGKDGKPGLTVAALAGRTKVVSFLLSAGALVDVKSKTADTPLLICCGSPYSAGRLTAIKLLLQHGAQAHVACGQQATPLIATAIHNFVEAAKLLLQYPLVNVDARDALGRTALCRAASGGHTELLQLLLDYKADPSIRDTAEITPLQAALAPRGARSAAGARLGAA